MFVAYIKDYNLPFEIYDSRLTGIVTDISDPTRIIFLPNIPDQIGQSWVGGHIIFSSGSLYGLGSVIAAEEYNGDDLRWIDLADPFAITPPTGETFWMVRRSGNVSTAISDYISLRQQITNISWSTDQDLGFDACTIELNERTTNISRLYSQIPGKYLEIQDVYGRRCFSGIVISAAINGLQGRIAALGIRHTFGWYEFYGTYDTTATNTSSKILRDVCSVNPYINPNHTFTIDRNNEWDTIQQAIGGVGPRDYLDIANRASDTIDDVLSLGYYGVSEDKITLQIYHDGVPFLKVIKRAPEVTDTDYLISHRNMGYGYSNIEIAADINEAYTNVFASYTDTAGDTFRTAGAYNFNLLTKFGIRSKHLSASGGYQESMSIVSSTRKDKSVMAGPGSITISGKIRRQGSTNFVPVYMVKAGDTIGIEGTIGDSSLHRNTISTPGIFVVGHTQYSASDDTLSISIAELPMKSELFANRIKV